MKHPRSSFFKVIPLVVASAAQLILVPSMANGQDKADAKKVPPPPGGEEVARRLGFPNPYPRLQALERELKKAGVDVKWTAHYDELGRRNIDAAALRSDPEKAQLLLGVRIADAIPALMAKNGLRLKACAADIKALAQVLNIRSDDISTKPIIQAIEKDDWDKVFLELGELQQQVVDRLDTPENRSKGALMAAGAWLQGLRYASRLISENQGKVDLSNYLRAAPIAELLGKEIKTASSEVLEKAPVKAALATLVEVFPLINIGRDDNIPKEKVQKIYDLATKALVDAKV